jgi:hypothetical protein
MGNLTRCQHREHLSFSPLECRSSRRSRNPRPALPRTTDCSSNVLRFRTMSGCHDTPHLHEPLRQKISYNPYPITFDRSKRLRLWQSKVRLCPILMADVEANSRRNILSNRLTKRLATVLTSYRQRTSQQRRVLASQTMADKQFPSTWKMAVEVATYVKAAGDSGATAQIPGSGNGLKG